MNKKNRKRSLLCLLLVLSMLVLPLWSCDDDGDGEDENGGGIGEDGSVDWNEVDFGGATVRHAISVKTTIGEGTFKPAMEYLRGVDGSTTDEVLKKVKIRNAKVENDLGLKVEYLEIDSSDIRGDIEARVRGSATDAPDVYTNDMSPLNFSIMNGYLTNVLNPIDKEGNVKDSYFDFDAECWNYEFMSECTLDKQNKVYILAGDYNIDLVRMAYVLFVNKTMFNQNAAALGFDNINTFYRYVSGGAWDYDMLTNMCKQVWQDDGSTKEKPDKKDSRLGMLINKTVYFIFIPSTDIHTFYLDEDGTPTMISDIDEMNRMGQKVRQLWENGSPVKDGIYYEYALDCIETFMRGRALFAPGMLGELESDDFRSAPFDKGLVVMPKYDVSRQEKYHTMISGRAELSAILVNAPSFAKASAYLQYINEQSEEVLTEYYEYSLKFKYNDDPAIRGMIDLVYETVDSPFGMYFENVIFQYLEVENNTLNLHYAISKNMLGTFYESWRDPYKAALEKALEDFADVP